ncbi:MAG: hypothetical protein FWG61_03060 [Firmicutes bacterium]|nr:hypothetical protein [Bacillota bacterium]
MKPQKRLIALVITACVFAIAYLIVSASHISIVIATSIGFFRGLQTVLAAAIIVALVLALLNFLIIINNLRKSASAKKRRQKEAHKAQTDPIKKLMYNIDAYLKANKSIDFFRRSLLNISEQTQRIQKQVSGIIKVAGDRFDEGSLSYNQFVMPVQYLQDHLLKLGEDVVQKLELFDEESYADIINRSAQNRLNNKSSEYEEVMNSYMEYIKAAVDSFEHATIKLDKLVLEIGKLNDEELQRSIKALQELDGIIQNTKLYK